MGNDLAMAGIGLRSNIDACKQLMEEDLLGTRRFAVVRDDFDQHQVPLPQRWGAPWLIHWAGGRDCSVN
jgi:hypothetical protein